jgi:fused signal recognition particle receptor
MGRFLNLFGGKSEQEQETQEPEKKTSLFERMKQAVTRTRENLSERIEEVVSVVPVGKEIDRDTLDMLEASLLAADLGTKTTQEVLDKLREKADRKKARSR